MGKIMHGNLVYSGGGGSVVEANPSDTASTNLNKIKIDGLTYNIPQGGGGGAVDDVQVDDVSVVDQNGIAHIDTMTGASANSAGTGGLVPAPAQGDSEKFLSGNGTWKSAQGGGGQGNILSGTNEPTSAIGSDGDVYYQYAEGQGSAWTADDEYLVTDAGTVFDVIGSNSVRHFTKTNDGKAIAVNYVSNRWSGGMLVSQDQLACYYSCEGGSVTTVQSTVIDGVTWYASTAGAWITGANYNTNGVAPDIVCDYSTQSPQNPSIIIPLILAAANERTVAVADSIVAVFFKQDGIWIKDDTGGASTISELTDVEVDDQTLTDGQVLKWDATEEKWVNEDESGGTIVVANPIGTAGADLNKIQIGSDIYAIPSGGGGGGSGYSETTLFTGTYKSYSGEITLDDDLDNYDQIIIWARWASTGTNGATPFLVERAYFVSHYPYDNGSTAQTSNHLVLCPYYNQYIRLKCGSANNKLFLFDAHSIAIERVAGLKYGGSGGGSAYSETDVWAGSADMFTSQSLNLDDDYTNYDALRFEYNAVRSDAQSAPLHYEKVVSAQTLGTSERFIISDFYMWNNVGVCVSGTFTTSTALTTYLEAKNWFRSCTLTKIVGIKY